MNDIPVIDEELYDALLTISDDDDFLLAGMSNVDHYEDKKALIEFIKTEKNITDSDVLLRSVILDQKRRGLIK